ncbi:MAG: hypothetical protein AAB736_02905 [Patescibacteria group bacterium]
MVIEKEKELEKEATRILMSAGFTKTGRDLKKERAEKEDDPKPAFMCKPKVGSFYPRVVYHHHGLP